MTESIFSVDSFSPTQEAIQDFSTMGLVKALPPQFQKQKEIEAIKENDQVLKALDGDDILEITQDENDSIYYIKTENALIRVLIDYIPQEYCGPAKFEVQFLDKQEIKS